MADKGAERAASAGHWAFILGSVSFLFQGRQLIPGVGDSWNDMALMSALLAVFYGYFLSRGGRTNAIGLAGGTLGAMMLFDMFLFSDFQMLIRSFNEYLPENFSAEAVFTFGLIVASLYFVVFKPMKKEDTGGQSGKGGKN